jgi:hypothetical protein
MESSSTFGDHNIEAYHKTCKVFDYNQGQIHAWQEGFKKLSQDIYYITTETRDVTEEVEIVPGMKQKMTFPVDFPVYEEDLIEKIKTINLLQNIHEDILHVFKTAQSCIKQRRAHITKLPEASRDCNHLFYVTEAINDLFEASMTFQKTFCSLNPLIDNYIGKIDEKNISIENAIQYKENLGLIRQYLTNCKNSEAFLNDFRNTKTSVYKYDEKRFDYLKMKCKSWNDKVLEIDSIYKDMERKSDILSKINTGADALESRIDTIEETIDKLIFEEKPVKEMKDKISLVDVCKSYERHITEISYRLKVLLKKPKKDTTEIKGYFDLLVACMSLMMERYNAWLDDLFTEVHHHIKTLFDSKKGSLTISFEKFNDHFKVLRKCLQAIQDYQNLHPKYKEIFEEFYKDKTINEIMMKDENKDIYVAASKLKSSSWTDVKNTLCELYQMLIQDALRYIILEEPSNRYSKYYKETRYKRGYKTEFIIEDASMMRTPAPSPASTPVPSPRPSETGTGRGRGRVSNTGKGLRS